MPGPPESSSTAPLTANDGNSSAELTAVVDELLDKLEKKFGSVSTELLERMDDMSRRLDSLEAVIQAGDGGSSPAKGK